MSFFTTGALGSGSSFETVLDDVWTAATFDYEWVSGTDATAAGFVYGSVDQGGHWFVIENLSYGDGESLPVGQVGIWAAGFTSFLPVNAIKVAVTAAAEGNTLTVRFTGK
ncbi:MAG TPA: hypothetical protein VK586_24125 [Streptosporangiaceae bacterium]|nr:hypothetical protein [Streptosporangiaceae bacterium]